MSSCGSSGGCGSCGGSGNTYPNSSPAARSSCSGCDGNCGCGGSCGGNCSCDGECRRFEVRYTEVPLGLPEDHSELKKPSEGFHVGMRVYNNTTKEYGEVKEVRYNSCVLDIDGREGCRSVYECRHLIPEKDAKAYEKRMAELLR